MLKGRKGIPLETGAYQEAGISVVHGGPPWINSLHAQGSFSCPLPAFLCLCPPLLNKPLSLTACKEDITQHQNHRGGRKKRGIERRERGRQGQKIKTRKEDAGKQALALGLGLRSQCALSTWQASFTPVLPQARVDV